MQVFEYTFYTLSILTVIAAITHLIIVLIEPVYTAPTAWFGGVVGGGVGSLLGGLSGWGLGTAGLAIFGTAISLPIAVPCFVFFGLLGGLGGVIFGKGSAGVMQPIHFIFFIIDGSLFTLSIISLIVWWCT